MNNKTALQQPPEFKWRMSISIDTLSIQTVEAPNCFWRMTQFLVLGIRWERL